MSKKVLFIHYSQSGQLTEIVETFKIPFKEADLTIENVVVDMENKFFFPWTTDRFFDAMPESVLGLPLPLEDLSFKEEKYDLIVFAYQPWFLSPSIPANSILSNSEFRKRLKGTPVLTIIGARNMWLNAQEKVKKVFEACGSLHIGNIALTDTNNNLVSAITILHWMLSGKKDRFLGFFPLPGVSEENISGMTGYGVLVLNKLQSGDWQGLQNKLVEAGAVEVKTNLMFIEARAGKLFSIWANLIIKKKNRRLWVNLYKYYLLVALFLIAPIVLTVYMLIFKPFLGGSIRKKKEYFLGIN